MGGSEYIQLLSAILGFFKEIGALPMTIIALVIIVGPWVLTVVLNVGHGRRFREMKEMYEHNVELVKNYEKVCKVQSEREQSLRDLIAYSTRINERLVDRLDGKASVN